MPEAAFTPVLDCGDDAGAAQVALREGVTAILFTGDSNVAARLADIAEQSGATVLTRGPPATLDLAPLFLSDSETVRRHCDAHLRRGSRDGW